MTVGLFTVLTSTAQNYKFDFRQEKSTKEGYIKVTPTDLFSESKGYGYDLQPVSTSSDTAPFFFSVQIPDGNYRITVLLGSGKKRGETTIRGESRRLFFENIKSEKGEMIPCIFTINKRNTRISDTEQVRIKPREKRKLNWDDKLTLEFNGKSPCVSELTIERTDNVPTVFLCGNSTVVDQDNEPWGSWGQMIPRFFNENICFANYAESGESANTFIAAKRLKKALTQMKPGDYVFMEFGHNDQKQKGPGKGAFYSFAYNLKIFIDEARAKGAHPILVTPTSRRRFDENGKSVNTHGDYPDAVRWVAAKENVPLIELNGMTAILFNALGVDNSTKAFVHYPAGTFPGQTRTLKDNTHFSTYGAYEVSKCVIEGMKKADLEIVKYLRPDYSGFDPAQPDSFESFKWNLGSFTENEKPDGN